MQLSDHIAQTESELHCRHLTKDPYEHEVSHIIKPFKTMVLISSHLKQIFQSKQFMKVNTVEPCINAQRDAAEISKGKIYSSEYMENTNKVSERATKIPLFHPHDISYGEKVLHTILHLYN